MPFLTDDGRPLDELLLAQRPADGHRFELRRPFHYLDPVSGRAYEVPVHVARAGEAVSPSDSDLASVPSWLWGLIASYGRQSAPALLHDSRSVIAAGLGDRRAALAQRRFDDRVFRTALREQGVPLVRAWLMWAWISADREREFGGAAGLVFVAQAVLGGLVVLGASVAAFWNPLWLVLLVVVVLAALVWGRLGGAMLVLSFSIAWLGPFVAVQLLAIVPFRLVEALVELVTGGDPVGVLRPTARSR
ncbi:DUF1353 domain-containing protein [Agromyces subbeticus]|uniref:DUF1353 domain-containing protein n=1 Tax=Agromyces subbeticus TaxID=293890 RepID=UPI0003B4CFA3|nr:DUF1353 domain-containing protein [Agromyces subbeticus]